MLLQLNLHISKTILYGAQYPQLHGAVGVPNTPSLGD